MSNWENWKCESCNKDVCICRECVYSYTRMDDAEECRCRLPRNRKCPHEDFFKKEQNAIK